MSGHHSAFHLSRARSLMPLAANQALGVLSLGLAATKRDVFGSICRAARDAAHAQAQHSPEVSSRDGSTLSSPESYKCVEGVKAKEWMISQTRPREDVLLAV